MLIFLERGAIGGLFHLKGVVLRIEIVTGITLKVRRQINFYTTCKIVGSNLSLECLLDDPIGYIANFSQKRGFGGSYII